jgi:hypothetical protein
MSGSVVSVSQTTTHADDPLLRVGQLVLLRVGNSCRRDVPVHAPRIAWWCNARRQLGRHRRPPVPAASIWPPTPPSAARPVRSGAVKNGGRLATIISDPPDAERGIEVRRGVSGTRRAALGTARRTARHPDNRGHGECPISAGKSGPGPGSLPGVTAARDRPRYHLVTERGDSSAQHGAWIRLTGRRSGRQHAWTEPMIAPVPAS